ncbi:uncharacterized endoplasmic reticulum membrane protein [[Candida] railenensis]|uniref:Uncharacterized endoplasmic reticulum membrane protein n=1 Tax=[Candida] railenensis TaxID=45579 RepID=A0A9P0QV95_9ASCO|nr:uncharacterized endoplasmic reticulum membrane protein [[Candida] railenensis]
MSHARRSFSQAEIDAENADPVVVYHAADEEGIDKVEESPSSLDDEAEDANEEELIQQYNAGNAVDEENTPIRTQSRLQRIQTQLSFFSSKLQGERTKLALDFGKIYLIMGFFVLTIFSIYWGSCYKRDLRFRNLEFLVVIDEDTGLSGYDTVGDALIKTLQTPEAEFYGKWNVFNYTTFLEKAQKHNNTIRDEVIREVHHQKYWAAIHVNANATGNLLEALRTANGSYTSTNNTITAIYETGRDMVAMPAYVVPGLYIAEDLWLSDSKNVTTNLANSLSDSERSALFDSSDALNLLTNPLSFEYIDRIPVTDLVLIAPSQVGLIYMIILTFFNVNFFSEIHQRVKMYGIKNHHYLLYRLLASMTSYLWLSLMYSFVTLGMQVDFTVAFGKSGFLVYWMTSWLTMWVVGSVNEIVAMWCILFYPPLMGFWLLFWVIVNIAPTFAPLALSPKVFRYGYGLPLHNSYEITKVIFCNTYKGQLGRNYGILFAWAILGIFVFLGTIVVFGKTMGKRKAAAAAKEAAAKNEKH